MCFVSLALANYISDAPIYVYIHGGYWQIVDICKEVSAHGVTPLVAAGIRVIVMNYEKCPKVSLEQLVDDMGRAIDFIVAYAAAKNVKYVSTWSLLKIKHNNQSTHTKNVDYYIVQFAIRSVCAYANRPRDDTALQYPLRNRIVDCACSINSMAIPFCGNVTECLQHTSICHTICCCIRKSKPTKPPKQFL